MIVTFIDLRPRRAGRDDADLRRGGAAVLLLITALAAWQSGRLLAPIRGLRETAEEISESDLSRRLPEVGNDDITALTRTFNAMLARLEAAFVGPAAVPRRRRPRAEDAADRAAAATSSCSTPTTRRRSRRPGELLLDEIDRMSRLVGDLILLAKHDRPDFLTPAAGAVERLTHTLLAKARGLADRDWVLDGAGEGIAHARRAAGHPGGAAARRQRGQAHRRGRPVAIGSSCRRPAVRIWVRDTGPGVPESDRDHVFERFGRSVVRPGDEGFGLGLRSSGPSPRRTAARSRVDRRRAPRRRFVITLPARHRRHRWPAS